LKYLNHYFYN